MTKRKKKTKITKKWMEKEQTHTYSHIKLNKTEINYDHLFFVYALCYFVSLKVVCYERYAVYDEIGYSVLLNAYTIHQ